MPKGRYAIMLNYMPKVGSLGLDMMLRTCTIQVNLDYRSEADMVKKFRVGLALQPLATALFANSPFTEGKPNGFLSFRSHIWSDTDPDRTGMLPFVFEDGFGYERYFDYALDVPMYFVFRDGKYIDVAGRELPRFPRRQAARSCPARSRRSDRLDRPSLDRLPRSAPQELPRDARRRRRPLEPDLRAAGAVGRAALRRRRARRGLGPGQALDASRSASAARRGAASWRSRRRRPAATAMRDLAGEVLAIAAAGLPARARLNSAGDNETGFLDPLARGRRQRQDPGRAPARQVSTASGAATSAAIYEEFSF